MSGDPSRGADDLDRLLTQTRSMLQAVRGPDTEAGASTTDTAEAEPLRVEGTARDGMVRAVVVTGGQVESVSVQPALLREGLETVCAEIVVAVNAALTTLRAQAIAGAPAGGDPAELSRQLGELQEQSLRQMAEFRQEIDDVVARLRGGR